MGLPKQQLEIRHPPNFCVSEHTKVRRPFFARYSPGEARQGSTLENVSAKHKPACQAGCVSNVQPVGRQRREDAGATDTAAGLPMPEAPLLQP